MLRAAGRLGSARMRRRAIDRPPRTGIMTGGTAPRERRMPSLSLQRWFTDRTASLDEMERAHRSLRGSGPGVRAATLQIHQAYTMLLSGQFQGYCRDFHGECVDFFVAPLADPALR